MEDQVYVIGAPGSPIVKIGVSNDVQRRLREIQYMSPVTLTVLWTTPGGQVLEQGLHSYFAAQRSHGEWFTFDGDPVAAVRCAVETGAAAAAPRVPRPRGPRTLKSEAKQGSPLRDVLVKAYGPPRVQPVDSPENTEWLYGRIVKYYQLPNGVLDRFTASDLEYYLDVWEPGFMPIHIRRLLHDGRIWCDGSAWPDCPTTGKKGPEAGYRLTCPATT